MKETMVPDRDDAGLVPPPPPVARLDPGELAAALLPALATGAVLARAPVAVVALTGPGAVTCMQGLLTNDVEHPGDGAFVYGALLTPKGMIVVDGWAARLGTTVSYTVPGVGRERALGVFTRSVPPRLARVSDRTSEVAVYRLLGPAAAPAATAAGLAVPPAPGRVLAAGGVEIARPSEGAPFALQITAPPHRRRGSSRRSRRRGPSRRPPPCWSSPGSSPGGPPWAPRWTTRRSRRKCATTRSAACRTPRAAIPARRPWRGSTSGAIPTASFAACCSTPSPRRRAPRPPRPPQDGPPSPRSTAR